jgi:uncharacterized protein
VETSHARQFIISATLLAALGAHLFLAWWLLGAARAFGQSAARRRKVALLVAALFVIAPLGRFFGIFYWKTLGSSFSAAGATEWMIVLLAAVPLAAIALASRGAAAWLGKAKDAALEHVPPEPGKHVTRREAVECGAGLVVLTASAVTLGWGSAFGRHEFKVEELVVRLPGLPKALDGYTIAQISDIHAGLFVGERELGEGLSIVRSLRPDLVVVTGDLLDLDARHGPFLARHLADLSPRDGVVAILGNHDYYAGFTLVTHAMRAAGIDLLVNEGRMIRPRDGGGFALLGVDDLWAQRSGGVGPDLDRALAMVPPDAARVLLAHQPNFFDTARGRVGLQLSGHTHGGQINPGFRPAELVMRYVSGKYEGEGTTMWVNRGFGVAGPPARVGAPPEVTKVVLVSA